jgi:hypothetical protein
LAVLPNEFDLQAILQENSTDVLGKHLAKRESAERPGRPIVTQAANKQKANWFQHLGEI